MKTWQKALILAATTEIVTISVFVIARLRGGISMTWALILHTPAVLLVRVQVPWLLAVLIETAVWLLIWVLLIRIFAGPGNNLTGDRGEWQQAKVKPIVPR